MTLRNSSSHRQWRTLHPREFLHGRRRTRWSYASAQLAHDLLHIVGHRRHVAFAVHLPQPPQTGFLPSQPVQGSEGSFRDGPPSKPFPLVRSGPVPLPGSWIDRVIYRHTEEAVLLNRREARFLDGTSLAILLACHIQVCPLTFMVRTPAQDLALGANQVVAMMDEIATGRHAGFLPGMNGDVRRDALFLQQFPQLADAVAGIPSQRAWRQGQPLQQIENCFPLALGGVSHSSGHDETAQVNDDVLLVMQVGRFTRSDGLPGRTVYQAGRFTRPDGLPGRTVYRADWYASECRYPPDSAVTGHRASGNTVLLRAQPRRRQPSYPQSRTSH